MDRPIVLCGLGRIGSHVLDYLLAAGMPVVIVDTVCKPDDPRLRGVRLVSGDCRRREVLEQAGVASARGVLILTNDDLINVSTALMVRGIDRDVPIVLRMFNQNLLARLGKAVRGVFALSMPLLTAPILAMAALTGQALGTYRLDDTPEGVRQLVEITVGPTSPLRDRTIGSLSANRDVVVIAHLMTMNGDFYLLEVQPDAVVRAGDHLVVHGPRQEVAPLLHGEKKDDSQLLWASWLYRHGRVAWRTLREMDVAVLVCTVVLLLVVVTGIVVLKVNVEGYSYSRALLTTVGVMATAGILPDDKYDSIRVFISGLRIVGAVLMAAFTAIVTNYLLRARLGGVLEVRRIPESGHVIVCGLSTVGFRVVEELVRLGTPVLAIESDSTNRFIQTSRRLGAAVVIGDATVIEVLRQAHAGAARAVVPATNNDMVNLEVALLVRELNPEQRIVVLFNDPQFAVMLRDAADVRLAVSVAALAAPAFLAGLYGDRVDTVFLLRGRLFAVIDLVIGEQDVLAGLTVRVVSVDYSLVPVALVHGKGPPARVSLTRRLEGGDRLVGIIALADLERLIRRQPTSAGFAVDVTACPLPARGWLSGLVRMKTGVGIEEADEAVERFPLRLARQLTRGQAEDLMAQLSRERVSARVCPDDEPLPASC